MPDQVQSDSAHTPASEDVLFEATPVLTLIEDGLGRVLPPVTQDVLTLPENAFEIWMPTVESSPSPRSTPPHRDRGVADVGMTAADIADYFLRLTDYDAGDVMTHLRLQKLVYYAQAWSLAIRNLPLFQEDFQAWVHGPVVPSLYLTYRDYGWEALPRPVIAPQVQDEAVVELLNEVWSVYGQFSAKRLEELTHSEEPWQNARRGFAPGERCTQIIPKEAMRRFYAARLTSSD